MQSQVSKSELKPIFWKDNCFYSWLVQTPWSLIFLRTGKLWKRKRDKVNRNCVWKHFRKCKCCRKGKRYSAALRWPRDDTLLPSNSFKYFCEIVDLRSGAWIKRKRKKKEDSTVVIILRSHNHETTLHMCF